VAKITYIYLAGARKVRVKDEKFGIVASYLPGRS
jgi:hypothetical protein